MSKLLERVGGRGLWLDIESFSSRELTETGVYAYTEAPDFEILMCAWSPHPEEEPDLYVGQDAIADIPGLFDPKVPKIAHNAPFERICFSRLADLPVGQYLDPEMFIDTEILAAEFGLPRKLAKLAVALGAEEKDSAGTRLINTFCKLNRGRRIMPEEKPVEWQEFQDYCVQDVRALIDCHRRLPDLSTPDEIRFWHVDQRINDRGIRPDLEFAPQAIEADVANRLDGEIELREILQINNANSVPQIRTGLAGIGLEVPNLQAETLEDLLDSEDLDARQRRALELRQELSLVAAKKYQTVLNSVCADGRLRGQFRFFGAHTGRWSSWGVQVQNLPKAKIHNWMKTPETSEELEFHQDSILAEAAILDLLLGKGADSVTLRALVRKLFFIDGAVVDYASIEARILAWIANEEWKQDAFRNNRDLYVENATRMGPQYTRAQGKIAELALGYNGSIHSLRNMGATGTDAELKAIVDAWRAASPITVRFWKKVERAFRDGGRVGDHVHVERDGSSRFIVLPSGRRLVYHGVSSRQGRLVFDDPKGYKTDTYGGRLTENIVQAIARDILAEALVRLEQAGYPVIWHVHDEAMVEQMGVLDEVTRIMVELPEWADGLLLAAEGYETRRYRKA